MGQGRGDWHVGTGTWDACLGRGTRGLGRGDVGTWGRGDVGTWGGANEDFRNENLTRVARVDLYGLET